LLNLGSNEIGDAGMAEFSSAISSRLLPSLHSLIIDDGPFGTGHPQLKAACDARRIRLL